MCGAQSSGWGVVGCQQTRPNRRGCSRRRWRWTCARWTSFSTN
jgi:hypothetical protein